MTKENGYQKRDREIERLRTVMDECALDLERLVENPAEHANVRAALLNWAEKLRHALNKRGSPMSEHELFNSEKAFAAHQGTYSDLRELLRALGELRWNNFHLLPVDTKPVDLMGLGRRLGYLTEHGNGSFTIKIEKGDQ